MTVREIIVDPTSYQVVHAPGPILAIRSSQNKVVILALDENWTRMLGIYLVATDQPLPTPLEHDLQTNGPSKYLDTVQTSDGPRHVFLGPVTSGWEFAQD